MENYFIIQLEETFKEINKILINSFVNIFGEKNRDKIVKIVCEVNLAVLGEDLPKEIIEEKLKYYSDELEKLKKDYIVLEDNYGNKFISKEQIDEDIYEICYQYNYYLNLLKRNKYGNESCITLYIKDSKNVTGEFLNFIYDFKENYSRASGLSSFYKGKFQIVLKTKNSNKINLRCYIHEIIHCLMYELLALIDDRKFIVDGSICLCSRHEIVNEIIVEYLTLSVLDDVNKNNKIKSKIVDIEFSTSNYLKVDELFNYIIKKTFLLLKPIIFNDIINGGSIKIIKILGSDNLKKIEAFMDKIVNKILAQSPCKEEDIYFSDEELNELKEFGDMMYNEIEKNCKEYFDICQKQKEYVDNLVELGLVRRV